MPKRFIPFAMLCAIMATTACGSSMKTPDIKQNPHPHDAFRIVVTLVNAPGTFDTAEGSADYKVVNDECIPLQPGSGARLPPEKSVPFTLERNANGTYTGIAYADLLIDENYYELGVCHWSFSVSVTLKKKGTRFIAAISREDFESKAVTWYFLKDDYIQASTSPNIASSTTDPMLFNGGNPQHIFSASLAAKRINP